MRRTAQRWTSAGLLTPLLLLNGGCGLTHPPAGADQQASAASKATMTHSPAPGAVTLRLGQMRAGVTDAVSVTVANHLLLAILIEDHRSECTMVTLERQEGEGWLAVAPCQLETPTRLVSILSGAAQTVTLRPQDGPRPQVWQAGTYRFTLRYSTDAQGQSSAGTLGTAGVAYSPTFTIG